MRQQPGRDDGNISQCVVARPKERRAREAPAVVPLAGEHVGASQVDYERAKPGQ